MKQALVFCILGLTSVFMRVTSDAQVTPSYIYGNFKTQGRTGYFLYGQKEAFKFQSIYVPTDFPGMPSGQITALYLMKIGGGYPKAPTWKYYNFKVSLGYTTDTFFHHPTGYDTFRTELIPVFSAPEFSFTNTDTVTMTWQKIPLGTNGNFVYDASKPFILQVTRDSQLVDNNGPQIVCSGLGKITQPRTLIGYPDSVRANKGAYYQVAVLGFDIIPTEVGALSYISSFGLFPNPASNGKFNVSFSATKAVQQATVTLRTVTGQSVFRQEYANVGHSFFKEIDMHGASPGIYFMELVADGDRIVRRVTIE
ncbi:MAG: T9SS type A sorting domain-containing protein [Chitinophagaceae bacterium]